MGPGHLPLGGEAAPAGPLALTWRNGDPPSPFFNFLCSLMVTYLFIFFPLRIKIEPLNFCFDGLLPGDYLFGEQSSPAAGMVGAKRLTPGGRRAAFQDSVARGLSWLCQATAVCLSFPICQKRVWTLGSVHEEGFAFQPSFLYHLGTVYVAGPHPHIGLELMPFLLGEGWKGRLYYPGKSLVNIT